MRTSSAHKEGNDSAGVCAGRGGAERGGMEARAPLRWSAFRKVPRCGFNIARGWRASLAASALAQEKKRLPARRRGRGDVFLVGAHVGAPFRPRNKFSSGTWPFAATFVTDA
jgi:hypothetical protein